MYITCQEMDEYANGTLLYENYHSLNNPKVTDHF